MNKRFFDNPRDMPEGAITMGIATILSAKEIVVITKGGEKAWGVHRSLTGPIGSDAPASYLRYHPNVTFLLDKNAADLLDKNNITPRS